MILMSIPIESEDLTRLETMLVERDPFTTTFQDLNDARYRAQTYLNEELSGGATTLLADRNITTRAVDLAAGKLATEEHRVVAACLAFAHTLSIQIEPNLSLYELEPAEGYPGPNEELRLFRLIDNTHPQLLADIALGRRTRLADSELGDGKPPLTAEYDFSSRPTRWSALYICVLKIVALELEGNKAEVKFRSLIEWMETDFLFLSSVFHFANQYWGSKTGGTKLLRHIRSRDRNRVHRSIKNATWDLYIATYWSRKAVHQEELQTLWILASLDRALHTVARRMLYSGASANHGELLREEFVSCWGKRAGNRFTKVYLEAQRRRYEAFKGKAPQLNPEQVRSIRIGLETAVFGAPVSPEDYL